MLTQTHLLKVWRHLEGSRFDGALIEYGSSSSAVSDPAMMEGYELEALDRLMSEQHQAYEDDADVFSRARANPVNPVDGS